MKSIILNLIIFATLFITGQEVYGQNNQFFCHTPSTTNYSFLNKSALLKSAQNNDHYCLKVYFHVIRRSDQTGGQSVSAVNQAFQILNDDFNPHNISFYWDNTIDYIDNTSYYNSPSASIFGVNNHQDGIDIYLYDSSVEGSGLANGVGGSSELYVTGSWSSPFQPLATSHVLSHEMGHVLFLWHTHHGTVNEGGTDAGQCPELVNGSNSAICGDYVTDTPADPYVGFNVNPITCAWLGSGTDANGHNYAPDTENIMAYTTPQCMSYFTPLQGLRMRNAIENLPYLQQALVNCCIDAASLDLYIKDSHEDTGEEPNTVTEHMWTSQDIWVRNTNDGGLFHQNPEYKSNGQPNYIYVQIINRSCETSIGNETVVLNWAKANTALAWPQNWNGSLTNSGNFPLGGELPAVSIPVLQAGGEAIVVIPWVVPNPNNYIDNDNPWHFCLLATIHSTEDPLSHPVTTNPNIMVRENNNQAWKNITVVDLIAEKPIGGVVGVTNFFNQTKKFKLTFSLDNSETGKPIFKEAEVTVEMDEVLFGAWEAGGKITTNTRPAREDNKVIITGDNAVLDNLIFEPNAMGRLYLTFNFLTQEITEKTRYIYHVVQKDFDNNDVIGGETYDIRKAPRELFFADTGGNTQADKNETVVLSVEPINEPAVYNWYDSEGNLIYEGASFEVSVEVARTYKIEIIALADGYKDYSEIEVSLKPNSIETIYPNPTSSEVTVSYKINEGESAYLAVTGFYGSNVSNNYILDINETSVTLDASSYPQGLYSVALIVNGQIQDTTTLIKQ